MTPPIPLRPHHGLCIPLYQGRGYSPEFTRRMAALIAQLGHAPPVRLTPGPDVLCAACPLNGPAGCSTPQKVLGFDWAVLAACGLAPGQVVPWPQFQALVQRYIFAPGRRAALCAGCQWQALCAAREAQLAAGRWPAP